MYQHLIDRADRRLRAVRIAKFITVGGPVVALIGTLFLLTGCCTHKCNAMTKWSGPYALEKAK